MEPSEKRLQPGTAILDGRPLESIRDIELDHRTLEIQLLGRAAIRIYTFNSLMLPIASKRVGSEKYFFTGPRLGMYHDTADIREGPFVNHFVNQLEIDISYLSHGEASLKVRGTADLSQSSIDPYWYKGARAGIWSFEAGFSYTFPRG